MDDFNDDADFLALAATTDGHGTASSTTNVSASTSAQAKPKVTQPTPQAIVRPSGPNAILVSPRQKGNPVLTNIKSVPWEYSDTPADYVLGATTCAMFLSLKYHRLHPEYIYSRIKQITGKFNLRVLLAMVDIDNHEDPLRELAKTSLVNNFTLILAWSAKEAARYLEAYKALEHAAPTAIRGQQAATYAERMTEFVTVPRGINKTDAMALVSAFGSIRAAVNARKEEVATVQGWGEIKVKRWYDSVREPFRVEGTGKKRSTQNKANEIVPIGALPTIVRGDTRDSADADLNAAVAESLRTAPAAIENDELFVPQGEPQMNPPRHAGSKRRAEEPELSEGMAAALAKYRS
ncbi:MAG: hypothetical protein GOMPHAMPRED_001882 [Gomphillus americanus]|uniref:ERCC1-like central domain-containing protein n=1 Tax=Gomphillus americanus TaxID=1940652 RepID=A0A8H3ILK1_9LECA|nr:MAG: hypothetical protein GOMPHAMPRED_001882 [Gomphillus americanus]